MGIAVEEAKEDKKEGDIKTHPNTKSSPSLRQSGHTRHRRPLQRKKKRKKKNGTSPRSREKPGRHPIYISKYSTGSLSIPSTTRSMAHTMTITKARGGPFLGTKATIFCLTVRKDAKPHRAYFEIEETWESGSRRRENVQRFPVLDKKLFRFGYVCQMCNTCAAKPALGAGAS